MEKRKAAPSVRLLILNRAIERNPDAAVNFVLRGEHHMEIGSYSAAQADFEHALTLAEDELQASDWGYLQQALIDQAERGLRFIESALF